MGEIYWNISMQYGCIWRDNEVTDMHHCPWPAIQTDVKSGSSVSQYDITVQCKKMFNIFLVFSFSFSFHILFIFMLSDEFSFLGKMNFHMKIHFQMNFRTSSWVSHEKKNKNS